MKRTETEILSAAVKGFLCDYLPQQRACSPHTILSYRDSLKLLLHFATGTKRHLTGLTVADLSPQIVRAFLDHLEKPTRQPGRNTQRPLDRHPQLL